METTEPEIPAPLPSSDQVDRLVDVAREAAVAAGDLVRSSRPDTVAVSGTKSSAVDVVTQMDLACEALVREVIARHRPDDGVFGEEEGHVPGTSGVTWVIDPIDGTVNYLYGIPAHAVSVAAVVGPADPARWTLVAGCVHAVDGRTWTAGLGRGARLDGHPVTVNAAVPLAESLVGTGFGYTVTRRQQQARVVAEVLPRVRDIRRMGSAALDLCQVAAGNLDLYYERGLQPWDLAAGALIAAEAGAVVTGLGGSRAGEAMTVAGPSGTVEDLVALLEDLRADQDG